MKKIKGKIFGMVIAVYNKQLKKNEKKTE